MDRLTEYTIDKQPESVELSENFIVADEIANEVFMLTGGVAPSLEAFCNKQFTKRCQMTMSGKEFIESEVGGNHIWLHPPYGQEKEAIEHYLRCKSKDATKTSAVIVVPSSQLGRQMPWTTLLKGMVLVKQFTQSDKIFCPDRDQTKRFGKLRSTEIWWDPPIPPPPPVPVGYKIGIKSQYKYAMATGTKQDMVFACTLDGQPALALIDSGASDTFIVASKSKGPITREQHHAGTYVECAGQNRLQISGRTKTTIRVGSYMDKIQAYVVEQLIEGIDIILGHTWLKANKVMIDYAKLNCTIRAHGNTRHTVTPLSKGQDDDQSKGQVDHFLTAMEQAPPQTCEKISPSRAAKALRNGADYLLVRVRQVEDPSKRSAGSSKDGAGGTAVSHRKSAACMRQSRLQGSESHREQVTVPTGDDKTPTPPVIMPTSTT